jgi:hypothetical protein
VTVGGRQIEREIEIERERERGRDRERARKDKSNAKESVLYWELLSQKENHIKCNS